MGGVKRKSPASGEARRLNKDSPHELNEKVSKFDAAVKTPLNQKELNIRTRDENIRIAEIRGRKIEGDQGGADPGPKLTKEEIRKKLRRDEK